MWMEAFFLPFEPLHDHFIESQSMPFLLICLSIIEPNNFSRMEICGLCLYHRFESLIDRAVNQGGVTDPYCNRNVPPDMIRQAAPADHQPKITLVWIPTSICVNIPLTIRCGEFRALQRHALFLPLQRPIWRKN